MDYTVSYRAPVCRGDEYTTVFEVAFADGTIYPVGGSTPCNVTMKDATSVVTACWADAEKHVLAMGARLDAKQERAPVVDLEKVPASVTLSKSLTATKEDTDG